MLRRSLFILIPTVAISAAIFAQATRQAPAADADVIAIERASLDRWAKGDPGGFLSNYATDVTYYDPSQERRIDGLQAMTAYLTPLRGKISIDRYEMLNTKVQRYGDVAVLTYNVVNYRRLPDGTERSTTRWNSTAVFHRADGRWREVHSHFSYTKPELK
jgi:uncharacterized protein (TIGR02246 family)